MKKLDAKAFDEIRLWIYRNARQIELAIWQYEFEDGSQEAVLSALAFYQNEDGGFGNALEPDNWNPNSSPYTTSYAINILKSIDFGDTQHPVMQGIIKFLESGLFCSEQGWQFSIPTNDDYPHAPWWTFKEETNEVEGIGISAELVSFIMCHMGQGSGLYEKALAISERLIEKLKMLDSYGDMGIGGYCVLVDTIHKLGLMNQFEQEILLNTVRNLVSHSIQKDTSQWLYYGVMPSNYITSPVSPYYRDNEDIVQKELDFLIETRPSGGVWNIPWSWFENNEKYAKEFAISENWWKGAKAIEKLRLLRNFSRL